jgi:hypothetical protein
MEINHEVISFDPNTGSIVVRYFTDDIQPGYAYSIDLPIVDGALPTEAEIQQLIDLHSPRIQLERIAAMKTASIPEYLANLTPNIPEQPPTEQ